MNFDDAPIVKRGTWLYAGTRSCDVRIVAYDVLFDAPAPENPEQRVDREVSCFYILYETAGRSSHFTRGEGVLTLNEALRVAEEKLGPTLRWE